MPVEFEEAPLIDDRRLDETVAIPLLSEVSGPAPCRSRLRHFEQERPQARRRQRAGQFVVRGW
jgi:hypothetical protein